MYKLTTFTVVNVHIQSIHKISNTCSPNTDSLINNSSRHVNPYLLYTAVVFKLQWTSQPRKGIPEILVWEPPKWVILGTCPLLRKGLLISFDGNQQYVTMQTTISGTLLYNCYSFNSTCSTPRFYGVQLFIIIYNNFKRPNLIPTFNFCCSFLSKHKKMLTNNKTC
jgi:hypothetical protein